METDALNAIKARVHSTELQDDPELAHACAVAGLAALDLRSAERVHASNRETVRNGTNGPGVLEVTEVPVKLAQAAVTAALDELADIFVARRAAEDQALVDEGLRSIKGQAAGTLVDAHGAVITDLAPPPPGTE